LIGLLPILAALIVTQTVRYAPDRRNPRNA
jgi:hypothetical protein